MMGDKDQTKIECRELCLVRYKVNIAMKTVSNNVYICFISLVLNAHFVNW